MSRAVSLISLLLLLMSLQQSSKASGFPEGMVAPDWQSSASAHFDQAPETTQQLRERLRNLTAKRNIRVERNVVYVTRGEDDLLMDVYMPEAAGSHAAVLVVHGGAWRSGSKAQLMGYARELASRGHVAFAINYRLAPDHIFPAQIEDCRAAIRFIHKNAEKYNVDRQRLGAIGYSAGGHLVALLGVQGVSVEVETTQPPDDAHRGQNGATTNAQLTNGQTKTDGGSSTIRLKAVVPGGAPCDFRAMPANSRGLAFWLGGTSREKGENYKAASPAAFVTKKCCPMFFFHGENDELVSLSSPQAMAKQLDKAGVKNAVHVVEGAGHLAAAMNQDALKAAFDFLDQHLQHSGEKTKPADDRDGR